MEYLIQLNRRENLYSLYTLLVQISTYKPFFKNMYLILGVNYLSFHIH